MMTLRNLLFVLLFFCLEKTIAQEGNASTVSLGEKIVTAARQQIGVTLRYDPSYQKLTYPLGDVPLERGVCTDVVVRALRKFGIDLQQLIHQHAKQNFHRYPKIWGQKSPDPNIDHRRVPNIMAFLRLKGMQTESSANNEKSFLPGDLVVWDLGRGVLHIGILSDKKVVGTQRHKVIHNICCGVREEDILDSYKVVGHYRLQENKLKN
jgi:uncharacterized protein YijF (DUF1287 family)